MIYLWLALAVVAAGWALDVFWQVAQLHEIREDLLHAEQRVFELGQQVQRIRVRQLKPIDRPIVSWWDLDSLESDIRSHNGV